MIYHQEILPTIYHKDQNSCAGGVMIAVRDKIHSERFTTNSELEILSMKIGTYSPLILSIVCMPPASTLDQYDSLFNYLAEIANENSIIIGDFNLPDITDTVTPSLLLHIHLPYFVT